MAKQQHIFITLAICSLIAFNCINAFKMVTNLQHFISTEKIEAEDYSSVLNDNQVYHDCSDPNVFYMGSLGTTTVIEYQQVDFLDGMENILLHAANLYSSAALDISLHSGNYTNPPFITIPVDYTGTDPCGFVTLNVNFDEPLTGVQDLYFTFPSTSAQGYIHLDWFVFNHTDHNFIATEKIEAEDFSPSTANYTYVIYHDCSDGSITYMGSLGEYTTLVYEKVDFGIGVQMVTVRVSSLYTGQPQDILLHLGNNTDTPIATIPVGQTGSGRCDFLTLNAFLQTQPFGVQDLFLTFPSSSGGYIHLDWFVFNQTVTHY